MSDIVCHVCFFGCKFWQHQFVSIQICTLALYLHLKVHVIYHICKSDYLSMREFSTLGDRFRNYIPFASAWKSCTKNQDGSAHRCKLIYLQYLPRSGGIGSKQINKTLLHHCIHRQWHDLTMTKVVLSKYLDKYQS